MAKLQSVPEQAISVAQVTMVMTLKSAQERARREYQDYNFKKRIYIQFTFNSVHMSVCV